MASNIDNDTTRGFEKAPRPESLDVTKCSISIDPNSFTFETTDEVEVLEDLIVAACSDAKGRAETQFAEQMNSMTGGLPLPPGMKLF